MIGSFSNSGSCADRERRLVAVQLRHHHVHQDEVDVARRPQGLDPLTAVLGEQDLHPVRLERAREREDVADVVVDDEDLLADEDRVRVVQLLEHLPLRVRQLRLDPVQEERRLVEQPLGRAGVLDDDRLRVALQLRLLAPRQLLARVDDHGQAARPLVGLHLLEQVEARHLRQLQVEHHAVERRLGVERGERLLGGADGDDLDVAVAADELDDRLPLRLVVVDDEQPADVAVDERLDPAEDLLERLEPTPASARPPPRRPERRLHLVDDPRRCAPGCGASTGAA